MTEPTVGEEGEDEEDGVVVRLVEVEDLGVRVVVVMLAGVSALVLVPVDADWV